MTETKLKRRLFNFQLKSYSTYLVPTGILLFGVFFGALAAGVLYSFEDPVLDAKRFRVSEKGICLITQPMIDRLEL